MARSKSFPPWLWGKSYCRIFCPGSNLLSLDFRRLGKSNYHQFDLYFGLRLRSLTAFQDPFNQFLFILPAYEKWMASPVFVWLLCTSEAFSTWEEVHSRERWGIRLLDQDFFNIVMQQKQNGWISLQKRGGKTFGPPPSSSFSSKNWSQQTEVKVRKKLFFEEKDTHLVWGKMAFFGLLEKKSMGKSIENDRLNQKRHFFLKLTLFACFLGTFSRSCKESVHLESG